MGRVPNTQVADRPIAHAVACGGMLQHRLLRDPLCVDAHVSPTSFYLLYSGPAIRTRWDAQPAGRRRDTRLGDQAHALIMSLPSESLIDLPRPIWDRVLAHLGACGSMRSLAAAEASCKTLQRVCCGLPLEHIWQQACEQTFPSNWQAWRKASLLLRRPAVLVAQHAAAASPWGGPQPCTHACVQGQTYKRTYSRLMASLCSCCGQLTGYTHVLLKCSLCPTCEQQVRPRPAGMPGVNLSAHTTLT